MSMTTLVEHIRSFLQASDIAEESNLAVACSGGPDSMALTLLAQEAGFRVTAITVDHGLRAESANEALRVLDWMQARGIPHVTLTWDGEKPSSNIQEAARDARYRLLSGYCKEHGIHYLLVAHTADDQAETFLLRLARGSGVDGLSGMRSHTHLHGLQLLRPLLNVTKADLVTYLETRNQPFLADPSNANTDYDRVRMRASMGRLAELGLTRERINLAASNLARARDYLETQMHSFLHAHARLFAEGYAELAPLPDSEELALRVLAHLLMHTGGEEKRPRLSELTRLYTSMQQANFTGATLMGCEIIRHKEGFLFYREAAAVADAQPLESGKSLLWDNRFMLANSSADALRVSALGQQGWLSLAREHTLCNPYPTKRILYSLPAIYKEDALLQVPHLGWGAPLCTVALRQR